MLSIQLTYRTYETEQKVNCYCSMFYYISSFNVPTHLDALVQQVHDVTAGHESVDVTIEALGEAGEQVQGHDHEVLVRHVHLVGALRVCDAL